MPRVFYTFTSKPTKPFASNTMAVAAEPFSRLITFCPIFMVQGQSCPDTVFSAISFAFSHHSLLIST